MNFWIIPILACFSVTGKAAEPLRVQLSSEPVSLDPARAEDGVSLRILGNVMEGLVGYDGQGKLVNRLAASFTVSRDGKTYRFKLRKHVKWSDGKPVTASEFVAAIKRAKDPSIASKTIALLGPLESVEERAGDVVFKLRERTSYFVHALALTVAYPVRADVLEFLAQNKDRWPLTSPSTGPYRIAEHQADRKFVLEKNAHYSSASGSHAGPDKVELVIVSDESTSVSLFEQGKIDVIGRIPSLEFERLKKKGLLSVEPFLATYFLSFNTRLPPMDDPRWRRAIAGSIDKKAIALVVGTEEKPACSWVPVLLEGGYSCDQATQDWSSSMAWVREQVAKSKVELKSSFDSNSRNTLIMEKVQADLKKNLDVRLSLNNLDWKTYVRSLSSPQGPAQIFRFGWLAPFLDSITHLEIFTTGNPNNYSGWSNSKYDTLVREIAQLKSSKARAAKIREAQKILVEDEAVVIPIYHYVQTHAVSARVSRFHANPFGVIRFDELRVK
jgi:oligopeptide transport system substrate-binding protein